MTVGTVGAAQLAGLAADVLCSAADSLLRAVRHRPAVSGTGPPAGERWWRGVASLYETVLSYRALALPAQPVAHQHINQFYNKTSIKIILKINSRLV